MSCEGRCDLVEFKVTSAHLVHVDPRPTRQSPADLEAQLSQAVKDALERTSHDCGEGCECLTGERVEVWSREQVKQIALGEYTAWFRVRLVKYRTPGECMPKSDPLPPGVRS